MGVKDYHIDDMALQRHAFSGAGYRIGKSILMHLNNGYVRSGKLDLQSLFTLEDCTAIVEEKLAEVGSNVGDLIKIINSRTEPEIEIGGQGFNCELKHKSCNDYSLFKL